MPIVNRSKTLIGPVARAICLFDSRSSGTSDMGALSMQQARFQFVGEPCRRANRTDRVGARWPDTNREYVCYRDRRNIRFMRVIGSCLERKSHGHLSPKATAASLGSNQRMQIMSLIRRMLSV